MCQRTVTKIGIGVFVALVLLLTAMQVFVKDALAKTDGDDFIRVKPKKEYMIMGSYAPVMVYEIELSGKRYIVTQGGYVTGICKK